MNAAENLYPLLVDANTGRPALEEGLEPAALDHTPQASPLGPPKKTLYNDARAGDSLRDQRWAVLCPKGETGDEHLKAIRPLMELRAQQQGREVRVYRLPALKDEGDVMRWRREKFLADGQDTLDLPLYQLILGDLSEVPLALQQAQSLKGHVGRLAFDDPAELRAYADKVARSEGAAPWQGRADAIFCSVLDGSGAARSGRGKLMIPAWQRAEERREGGTFAARAVQSVALPRAWPPEEFAARIATDGPAALLSMSHGLGVYGEAAREPRARRDRQGALCLGGERYLTAADIAREPAFLPGGLWFMFACFSAGTPASSAFAPWVTALIQQGVFKKDRLESVLRSLPGEGEQPFIAALPKAALAHERGPLAFIGHIDLGWTYGYESWDLRPGRSHRHIEHFLDVLRSALAGEPVGLAFSQLIQHAATLRAHLLGSYQQGAPPTVDRALGHRWMLLQDLQGYILLGDPAARLEVERAGASAEPPAPEPPPAVAPASLPLPIEQLEEVIGALLRQELTLGQAARQWDLEQDELRDLFERYRAAGRAALGLG